MRAFLVLGCVVVMIGCDCGPSTQQDGGTGGGAFGGGLGGGTGGGGGGPTDSGAPDSGAPDSGTPDSGTDGGITCQAGFELVAGTCTDIDECTLTDRCDQNATCTNTPGTFTCTCNAAQGWSGDGLTCERRFAELSAGERHVCARMVSGGVLCWGFNENGALGDGTTDWRTQPTLPSPPAVFSSVGAGDFHSCGVRSDGTLWCWGFFTSTAPDGGPADSTTPLQVGVDTDWRQVAGTNRSSCGVKTDGRVFCWGGNFSGETGVTGGGYRPTPTQLTALTNIERISAGVFHQCGLTTSGSLFCWGDNFYSQRGNGAVISGTTIARAGAVDEWAHVGVGGYASCGIKKTGELWCWGQNSLGQINPAAPTTMSYAAPQRVGTDTDWVEVVGGHDHLCGRKQSGAIHCQGSNRRGQAAGAFASHQPLTRVGTDVFSGLTAGEDFTCALKADGTAYCWGNDADAQLGQRRLGLSLSARVIGTETTWSQVSLGRNHTCALKTDGSLWCWGAGWQGQLGQGNLEARAAPTRVGNNTGWTAVSAGESHTCGVRGGSLYCWGENQQGQVGIGTFDNRQPAVQQVGTATDWATVSCGGLSCCAQKTTGGLWCWGYNLEGQLGINSTATRVGVPTQVGTATDWTQVSMGNEHACARRTDNSLWCWGYGLHGQLGRGSQSDSNVPVRIGTGATWSNVGLGYLTSAGVEAGALRAWGFNFYGQTGTGSPATYVTTPTGIGVDTDWAGVAMGVNAGCATRTSNALWCWGISRRGLQASGTTATLTAPALVTTPMPLRTPDFGFDHACSISVSNGRLVCWGENSDGQLGDGTGFEAVPLQVAP